MPGSLDRSGCEWSQSASKSGSGVLISIVELLVSKESLLTTCERFCQYSFIYSNPGLITPAFQLIRDNGVYFWGAMGCFNLCIIYNKSKSS